MVLNTKVCDLLATLPTMILSVPATYCISIIHKLIKIPEIFHINSHFSYSDQLHPKVLFELDSIAFSHLEKSFLFFFAFFVELENVTKNLEKLFFPFFADKILINVNKKIKLLMEKKRIIFFMRNAFSFLLHRKYWSGQKV